MKALINKIKGLVEEIYNFFKDYDDYEKVKNIIDNYYGSLKADNSVREFCKDYNYDYSFVRTIIAKIYRISNHPARKQKSRFALELLDSLKDENNIVKFEDLKAKLGEDFKYFIIVFNVYFTPYDVNLDKQEFVKLDLTKIALDVIKENTNGYYTPEELYAEYVEYFQGYDIELDLKVFTEILNRKDEYPNSERDMYEVDFVNLSCKENTYFYMEMRQFFKELLKISNDEYVNSYLKKWLNIYE